MSTAAKDSRICELFTEGCHHRNLSVMTINKNMYYNMDPTKRRNWPYLALFNNPADRQQVMILARQMYPENTQYLLRQIKEATSKPYGYLLIDLKPTTPEHLRRSNFWIVPTRKKRTRKTRNIRSSTFKWNELKNITKSNETKIRKIYQRRYIQKRRQSQNRGKNKFHRS